MPSHNIDTISLATFRGILSRYADIVPEKLQELDQLRYETIPGKVSARASSPILTKDEVEKLVEWKLKHGTFRPKLLSLVQSNSTDTVHQTTTEAAKLMENAISKDFSPLPALKVLTQLKGIGPATASLLLSVMRPDMVPFFSDELFRWATWNATGSPGGWKRGIKYNVKEYAEIVVRVARLRARLGEDVKAVDAERVAWVLGKEAFDVNADNDKEGRAANEVGSEQEEEDNKKGRPETHDRKGRPAEAESRARTTKSTEAPSQGTKRKAGDLKIPTEGVRKSSRTRK